MSIVASSAHQFEMQYCSLCDLYFNSKALLRSHLEQSGRHPRCETCKRCFLNKNSMRNHCVYSAKHHYCRACDRSFQSSKALEVHLDQSVLHSNDSDDEEEEDDGRPAGWEDDIAREMEEEERRKQTEEVIDFDQEEERTGRRMSMIRRRAAMMDFMTRRMRIASSDLPGEAHSYSCPICLSYPRSVSATRCGHLFCAQCIKRAIDTKGACPTCRKSANMVQIRKVDLGAY